MKKNFFKLTACVIATMMVLGTTAFAATTTTTTYKTDKIEVTTTVTGATDNEQVTYLVHNSADTDIADSEIIYINQKAAVDGTASFTYKVNKDALNLPSGTKVISGSASGASLETTGDNIDPLYVTVDNKTSFDYTLSDVYLDNILGNIEEGSLTVDNVTGGTAYVNGVAYTGAVTTVGGQTYTITFEEEEVVPTNVLDKDYTDADTVNGNELTAWGTVSNVEDNGQGKLQIFGIDLHSPKYGDFHFPAYGWTTDGRYAIKLVDLDDDILSNPYTITPFLQAEIDK